MNISKQIVYIEDTKKDLALINDEVNRMLTELQDSVNEAIYKLDRLYNGGTEDAEAAKAALAELEAQYKELIDYLTHSGLTNTEVEDALTALNKLTAISLASTAALTTHSRQEFSQRTTRALSKP